MNPRIMYLTALLYVPACDVPQELECPDGHAVNVTIDVPSGIPIAGDLTLTGTADHTAGLAIRSLAVLGVAAESTGFNFDRWKVKIPFDVLIANAGSKITEEGREVTLEVEVREPCDVNAKPAKFVDTEAPSVFIEPPVRLGTMTASVEYISVGLGGGEIFAPAYVSPVAGTTATLRLSSDPAAGGAKVQLDALGVLFDGVLDRSARRLDSTGSDSLAVRSARIGENSIIARAGEDVAGALLLVGGRPVLSPSVLSLAAGGSAPIRGIVEGGVPARVACEASASTGVVVSSKRGSLTQPGGAVFDLGVGQAIDFIIEAADDAPPGLLTVTCTELAYKQIGEPLVVTISG